MLQNEKMSDELNAFLEYILKDNNLNISMVDKLWSILQENSDFDEAIHKIVNQNYSDLIDNNEGFRDTEESVM